MRRDRDDAERIRSVVQDAHRRDAPLSITGSGTKAFFGAPSHAAELSIADHVGVIDYRPDELVITARAGTSLADLELVLAAQAQMLPFDPPLFASGGTLGGALASGLSGPARPWQGAVRDAVLGVEILTGTGQRLRFGGQVMKNVAGYDVSRLMVGAFGTLGVLLSASVRLLPRPELETTCVLELDREAALDRVVRLGRSAEPVNGTCHVGDRLYVRFAGTTAAVRKAAQRFGGERTTSADDFWHSVRDHHHPFFRQRPVWRFSVPCATRYPALDAEWLTEWGGAQRWCITTSAPKRIFSLARELGGHAIGFRDAPATFAPLDRVSQRYHARLKTAFDPARILNRARMYPEL
jgi:glycolate oxidase FAD binding subunit